MRVLIFGANGRTGQHVVDEALSRGHHVTALVRNASSLPPRDKLAIIQGSPMELSSIIAAIEATGPNDKPEAILITLNTARTSDNPFAKLISPPRLLTTSVSNALEAMKQHGIRKIVYLSAFGVGSSYPNMLSAMKLLMRYSNLGKAYEDHEEAEKVLRPSQVDWVIARPVMLTDKDQVAVVEHGEDGATAGWVPSISRASVASYLIDALGSEKRVETSLVISN